MFERIVIPLSICLIICSNYGVADDSGVSPFEGKSFAIWSTVFKADSDELKPIAHLKESYSMEQARARIEIDQVDSESRFKTIYHDGIEDITILTKSLPGKTTCTLTSVDQFNFMVGSVDLPTEFKQISEEFLIGPAKLIFFIARNFRLKDWQPKELVQGDNVKTYEYLLKYDSNDGLKYTFQVMYDETSIKHDRYPIPLSIRYSDERRQHMFSFSRPEVLDTTNARDKQATSNNQVAMDYFSFPVGAGCSSTLKAREKVLFDNLAEKDVKFSFTAKEDHSSDYNEAKWKKNHYVAYDSSLKTMRVDRITGVPGGLWKQVHQFNLCRTYHITITTARKKTDSSGRVVDMSSVEKKHCVVSNLPCDQNGKNPTLAELLTGADKFVYMGKAKVRGVNARVYESRLGVLPAWFEMPLTYIDQKNDSSIRYGDLNEKVNGEQLINVVIYTREDDQEKQILLMEIEKSRPPVLSLDSKQSISIYNFKWNLDHVAPDGSRQDELFSLEGECNTINRQPEYRLSVDFTSNQPISGNSSLNVPSSRNLALLSTIQSVFGIQAVTVTDIESKISKLNDGKTTNSVVHTSLRFTKPPRWSAVLKYFGQGFSKTYSSTIQVLDGGGSIRDCFNSASHLGYVVAFGYDPIKSRCIIDTKPLGLQYDYESFERDGSFKLGGNYSYEIYTSMLTDDLYSNVRFFGEIGDERKYLKKEVELSEFDKGSVVKFQITGVKVQDNRKKVLANLTEQADKISGFGLLPSDQPGAKSWIVNPLAFVAGSDQPEEDSEFEMTIDQCKTACMTDTSCRSYSTCLKESRIQCTLSEVAFTSKNLMKQFNSDSLTKAKRNSRVRVNVTLNGVKEPLPVELSKNPTCQINNKIYTDFYRLGSFYQLDTQFKDIYQSTENVEDCARMCLEANLETMEADMSKYVDKDNNIIVNSATGDLFRDRWLNLIEHVCHEFQYASKGKLAESTIQDLDKLSMNRQQVAADNLIVNGYCFFDMDTVNKREKRPETDTKSTRIVYLQTQRYFYNFEMLYEKIHGVRLKPSPLSPDEEEVLSGMFQYMWQPTGSQIPVFDRLSKNKFNHQQSISREINDFAESCAADCALQRRPLFPSCRSFDVVIEHHGSKQTITCFLNTITLKEAKAYSKPTLNNLTSLIWYDTKDGREVWHFEPKAGFILSESMFIYDMEHHHPVSLRGKSVSFGNFFGLLIVIALGVVCGLVLGLQLGRRLVDYSDQYRRQSINDILVNRNVGIDMNNIDK